MKTNLFTNREIEEASNEIISSILRNVRKSDEKKDYDIYLHDTYITTVCAYDVIDAKMKAKRIMGERIRWSSINVRVSCELKNTDAGFFSATIGLIKEIFMGTH